MTHIHNFFTFRCCSSGYIATKGSEDIECLNVKDGSKYINTEFNCNSEFTDEQMIDWNNGTKITNYKIVSSEDGMLSFRKTKTFNSVRIVTDHENLNTNSSDYCVS